MSNVSMDKASESIKPPLGNRLRHSTALAMFLVFSLAFVTPSVLAGPTKDEPAPEVSEESLTETSTPSDASEDAPIEAVSTLYCESAQRAASVITNNYLNAESGSVSNLQVLIDSIEEEVSLTYTGPDRVRKAMVSLGLAAIRATNDKRTNQELTPAGLSEGLQTPIVVGALDTILKICE